MTTRRIIGVGVVLFACSLSASAQYQQTGTTDYVLGNSSVMWLPSSSSLFLNPGELARLHQNEFLVTSGRFQTLASMSGSLFVPNTGTFALGAAPEMNSTFFSVGFGRLIGDYSTAGAALSVIPNVERSFRFSFGGALHVPTSGPESGMHAGLSVTNLPTKAVVNVGAGYWLLNDVLRIQLATQTRMQRAEFLGAEVRIAEGLQIQAGTRGFKKLLGGVSYALSYATVAFGAGPEGISFSMNVRIGDAASEMHDRANDLADEAFADGRYGDAKESFLNAVQYDEYDISSRQMAEKSQHFMDSSVTVLLRQAQEDENQRNYTEAMRAYAQILKIDPRQSMASSNLANVQNKLKLYVRQLLITGDSLKNRNDITRARRSYDLALELDPENDSISVRIDALESLSKENVHSMLSRARSLLRKNQLDEAEKEFGRVLAVDPENSQARSGLRAVSSRKIELDVSRGKSAFAAGKYFDALQIFADIIKRDAGNKEASQWLERSRDALKSDADKFFKTGLQFYIKEDFKSAIEAWDKVLMIQPSDSSTLEYRKRAEEKLKALEQFK